ncbi:MAG: hypothetical protein DRJ61_04550 [Acidobacteria bacterium]|nr:MAG: hypothetical protein DRJ61_04550 [Acidobacteriota bacterium]
MPAFLLVLLVILTPVGIVSAEETTQTDWSSGPAIEDPSATIGNGFTESSGISWLTIPGQMVLSSQPLATPVKHLIATGHDGAYGLYATDFDGDGDIDVIGTTDRSREVIIWFNNGTNPVTWTEHIVDNLYSGGTSIHPVDMDDDGDLDLVGAAQTPGNNVMWWRNEGGNPPTWTRLTIESNHPVACNLFVADIDGDGDPDVISTSWSGNYIAWWRNEGEGENWTLMMIDDQFPTAHSAFAFDADGDNDNDIVGTSADSGEVVLFLNDQGSGALWTRQVIGTGMAGVRYATAADVDGDGLPDIGAAAANGQIRWWRNEGGSPVVWTEYLIDQTCFGGHYLIVGDLNGDGANDFLVAAWATDSIFWYIQDPSDPEGWERIEVESSFRSALTAFPADIDGDGDLDVVGTSPGLGEVAWWEITDFVPIGTLQSTVLDLGEHQGVNGIQWRASVPTQRALTLSVRSSDDPSKFGPWSPELVSPVVMLSPWKRYFQYRVLMTSEGADSPLLNQVTVFWNGPNGEGPQVTMETDSAAD